MNYDVNLGKQLPGPYKVYMSLDREVGRAAESVGLSRLLIELVKIRVSQLNGCGFCLRLHTRDAIVAGESTDRLAVLPAWWETQYFTAQEKAALYLAERVTRVGEDRVPAVPAVTVDRVLTDQQIAAVAWVAVTVNGWNRIAIASHYPVDP